MKAFLVGLLFLFVVALLIVLGILLFPFLVLLDVMMYAILSFVLVILAIWLLGKFILYLWQKMK